MVGKKPEKKPFGRDSPPRGYPKDQSQYADPENWRYPLHTPWHARAARRYFDEWANRGRYTEEERSYIDWRIDQSLNKFDKQSRRPKQEERPAQKVTSPKEIDELSVEDILQLFLGSARLKRATEIGDSLVSVQRLGLEQMSGHVKDYIVQISTKNRTIIHDCQDWRNHMESKSMCKHLGKFILTLDQTKARVLLLDIIKNKHQWTFTAP